MGARPFFFFIELGQTRGDIQVRRQSPTPSHRRRSKVFSVIRTNHVWMCYCDITKRNWSFDCSTAKCCLLSILAYRLQWPEFTGTLLVFSTVHMELLPTTHSAIIKKQTFAIMYDVVVAALIQCSKIIKLHKATLKKKKKIMLTFYVTVSNALSGLCRKYRCFQDLD